MVKCGRRRPLCFSGVYKTMLRAGLMAHAIYFGQIRTDLSEELSPATKLLCELDLATQPPCISVPSLKVGRARVMTVGFRRSGEKPPGGSSPGDEDRSHNCTPRAWLLTLVLLTSVGRPENGAASVLEGASLQACLVQLPCEGHTGKHPDYIALLARGWESVLNLLLRSKHMWN